MRESARVRATRTSYPSGAYEVDATAVEEGDSAVADGDRVVEGRVARIVSYVARQVPLAVCIRAHPVGRRVAVAARIRPAWHPFALMDGECDLPGVAPADHAVARVLR